MHPGVQFNMDRIVSEALFTQNRNQLFQGVEVGNGGLHTGFYYFREEIRSGGEHQDWEGNTIAAEFQALYGVCYGKVIGPCTLHHCGKLHCTVTIRVCLDQNKEFGLGLKQGAEITVVAHRGIQVKLQTGKIILNYAHIVSFPVQK